jgi:hypothetical protein
MTMIQFAATHALVEPRIASRPAAASARLTEAV